MSSRFDLGSPLSTILDEHSERLAIPSNPQKMDCVSEPDRLIQEELSEKRISEELAEKRKIRPLSPAAGLQIFIDAPNRFVQVSKIRMKMKTVLSMCHRCLLTLAVVDTDMHQSVTRTLEPSMSPLRPVVRVTAIIQRQWSTSPRVASTSTISKIH